MEKKTFDFEIPFGAKDSELVEATYYIPEGMEAVIENNKVVIRKKESEDEKIRKVLLAIINEAKGNGRNTYYAVPIDDILAWLEKQKSVEWSDEDEHRAKDTIYFLDTAKKHYASTYELDACIDWLNSLKDRI